MGYWQNRAFNSQLNLTNKTIEETEEQLIKYYRQIFDNLAGQFEKIYLEVFSDIKEGEKPDISKLYQLEGYWRLQGEANEALQKLGDKEIALLTRNFEKEYNEIYEAIPLPKKLNIVNHLDKSLASQMINQIWVADGKSWSDRVWEHKSLLRETLNEGLVNCLVAGRKPSALIKELETRFNVSYNQARTIVRTETSHIQTLSAKQRYEDSGIQQYRVLVKPDARTCPICKKMDGKIFYLADMVQGVNAPPFHPNDRCCIVPIIN